MTWRWKNIYFSPGGTGGGGPGGGGRGGGGPGDIDYDKMARAQALAARLTKDRLSDSKKELDVAKVRLRLAEDENASIREIAKLEEARCDATLRHQSLALKRQRELAQERHEEGIYNDAQYAQQLRGIEVQERSLALQREENELAKSISNSMADKVGFITGVEDKSSSLTSQLMKAAGSSEGMSRAMKTTSQGVLDLLSPANVFGSLLDSFVEGFALTFAELESALPKFAAATGAGRELHGELVNITKDLREFGVGMEEGAQAMGALIGAVGNFNRMGKAARKEMTILAATLETVGVS